MSIEEELDIKTVENLQAAIEHQKKKVSELRSKVRELKFIPVDPVGYYSSVTYKAIDGGIMKINFDPFEIDYAVIADSYGNVLQKFVVPKGWKLSSDDFIFLNNDEKIKNLLNMIGVKSVVELSEIFTDPKTAMEIAEYAWIFHKIASQPKGEKTIVMRDGLLRTKKIKEEYISVLRSILKKNKDSKLVGVSKTSKLLSLISSVLYLEGVFPKDHVGYVEIPLELELMAYTWTGRGMITKPDKPLTYAFGKLYIAKLARSSNLLVTVEIPYDLAEKKPIYSEQDIRELFGHLVKDSKFSYPVNGYPQTIMRAHEKAAQLGFTSSIVRDRILEEFTRGDSDSKLKNFIRDYEMAKEIVDKGVLGGGIE